MATEKEKAIQVKYIISRVHVEKKDKIHSSIKDVWTYMYFFPLWFPDAEQLSAETRKGEKRHGASSHEDRQADGVQTLWDGGGQ